VPRVPAPRPNNDHHTAAQQPRSDDARLAVVAPIVDSVEGETREQFCRIGKIEAGLAERPLPLSGVKGDLNPLM
jgi:hypothetical protein